MRTGCHGPPRCRSLWSRSSRGGGAADPGTPIGTRYNGKWADDRRGSLLVVKVQDAEFTLAIHAAMKLAAERAKYQRTKGKLKGHGRRQ